MNDIKFNVVNFGYNQETTNTLKPAPYGFNCAREMETGGKTAISSITKEDIALLKSAKVMFIHMHCTSLSQLHENSIEFDKLYHPGAYIFPWQKDQLSVLFANYSAGFEIITPAKAKAGKTITVKPLNYKIDFKKGIQYQVYAGATTTFIFQIK